MSNNLFGWICIAIVFLSITLPFVVAAVRYRERSGDKKPTADGSGSGASASVPKDKQQKVSKRDIYLFRFICQLRQPFPRGRSVCLRPEYHQMIRSIVLVIGDDELTVAEYVDKALKAHFDDNRATINELYREKTDEFLNAGG